MAGNGPFFINTLGGLQNTSTTLGGLQNTSTTTTTTMWVTVDALGKTTYVYPTPLTPAEMEALERLRAEAERQRIEATARAYVEAHGNALVDTLIGRSA